jgi:hypothetical protein
MYSSDEALTTEEIEQQYSLNSRKTRIRKLREDYKAAEDSPIESLLSDEVVVVEDLEQSDFPKPGKTRMPANRASIKVIGDLGFDYEQKVCGLYTTKSHLNMSYQDKLVK